EIVVQPEALRGEVLADHRHREVRPALPAQLLGQPVAQVARRIGAPAHLAQQLLPLAARPAAVLPIRARVFAPVIEELDVLALERRDLALDERVELGELALDLVGDREVHAASTADAAMLSRWRSERLDLRVRERAAHSLAPHQLACDALVDEDRE